MIDPEANGGRVARKLSTEHGFQPMRASLFDQGTFWFYMVLAGGGQMVEVPLPESLGKDELERSLMAGLKRFDSSFTKNIALNTPAQGPPMPQYGMAGSGPRFSALQDVLSQEHAVTEADLEDGRVPAEADLLLVVAPENLDEKQLFWEYLNYVLALIGLLIVWIVKSVWRGRSAKKRLELLHHAEGRIG